MRIRVRVSLRGSLEKYSIGRMSLRRTGDVLLYNFWGGKSMRELGSLLIDGDFLDEHTMGELEDKIWEWLEDEHGVCQGVMAERGLALKITLIQEGRS